MEAQLVHNLARSRFIRSPWIWERIGTEADYLRWLSERPCCCCNGRTDVSGVAVAENATRFPWAPMCLPCRTLLVTRGMRKLGERIIGDRRLDGRTARQYLEHQRTEHAAEWAFIHLPKHLSATGWDTLSRKKLTQWALSRNVYVPLVYALNELEVVE